MSFSNCERWQITFLNISRLLYDFFPVDWLASLFIFWHRIGVSFIKLDLPIAPKLNASLVEKNAHSIGYISITPAPPGDLGSRPQGPLAGTRSHPSALTHLPGVLIRGCQWLHMLLQLLGELVPVMGEEFRGQDNKCLHHLQGRIRVEAQGEWWPSVYAKK